MLFPDELHRLAAVSASCCASNAIEVTFDQDFDAVIRACAAPRDYADGTWITEAMQDAYVGLHRRGFAHSVRSGTRDKLVGGLYGLAMGQLFFGESMFSRADNASKYGFATLVQHLKAAGFVLIDCQMPTDHLHSLGARSIPRGDYADYLRRHLRSTEFSDLGLLSDFCAGGLPNPPAYPEG